MHKGMALTSSAFEHNGMIPAKYTCDGDRDLSPPLVISGVPEAARALVLIMDDPDIPQVKKEEYGLSAFDHWTLFNIPPETREIPEGGTAGTLGATTRSRLLSWRRQNLLAVILENKLSYADALCEDRMPLVP